MGFVDVAKVQKYLDKRRMRFVTSIRARADPDVLVLTVPESAVGKVASSPMTSRRQLSYLRKAIERDLRLTVEFVFSRGKISSDMEAGLNALLQTRYPRAFQGCFTSLMDSGTVDVSVERTATGTEVSERDLERAVRNYLRAFGIELGVVRWPATKGELPSMAAILREIKISSPAAPSDLARRLEAKGFRVPSILWLQPKLDHVRRKQLAIRRQDGRYILTERGLSVVPHRKGRQGSDIERALALGKMRW